MRKVLAAHNMFQSLFFWIHFYNLATDDYGRIGRNRFQSLFFWIHFYNPPCW